MTRRPPSEVLRHLLKGTRGQGFLAPRHPFLQCCNLVLARPHEAVDVQLAAIVVGEGGAGGLGGELAVGELFGAVVGFWAFVGI